jgi:hypothetical protein
VKALYDSFQIEVRTFLDNVIHEPEEVLTNEVTVCAGMGKTPCSIFDGTA